MKSSFIIGIVWTCIAVLVLSFLGTVFFINNFAEKNDAELQNNSEKVSYQDNDLTLQENKLNNTQFSDNTSNKNTSNKNNGIVINSGIVKNINSQEEISISQSTINDETEDEETVNAISSNVKAFVKPIRSEVLNKLSVDELMYSKTLDEWRVHTGIDYEAHLGDEVFAVNEGTIKEIGFNYIYGNYIIIDHGKGYESLYANITVLNALNENDNVEQGQLIGYVAESFRI